MFSMTKFSKHIFSIVALLILFSCSSKDECKKDIIVQYEQTTPGPSGTTFIPEITQEVPCDFPEPEIVDPNLVEGSELENFTYDIISFNYTPDTGNNTSKVQFEIKLNNNNNFIAKGYPILRIEADGIVFSSSYQQDAITRCNEISANSSCTFTLDKEYPILPNIPQPSEYKLVSVTYLIL